MIVKGVERQMSMSGGKLKDQNAVGISEPLSVAELFARAAIGLDADDDPVRDDPTGRVAIVRLHSIATRDVVDVALAHCTDQDPLKRQIGADVLAQLGHSRPGFEPIFVEERVGALLGLIEREQVGGGDANVLTSACIAFGHLHDARAINALLDLSQYAHENVRHGVAFALSSYDVPEAVDGLIALSADSTDHVRDWATFGLGQFIKSDTPAIRAALRARLDDPCIDARNEAIERLATRGDLSVVPVLIRELASGNVSSPILDAAAALATPDLCEGLTAAANHGLVWEGDHRTINLTEDWKAEMKACGCKALPCSKSD